MTGFFIKYWDVIAFYTLVVILLYLFRSKFEFQGIIALLKTKLGLNFMTNTGKKHPVFWHRVGMLSIILGFAGMAFITIYLFYGLYSLVFIPSAPAVLSPVIPGVKIPGVPITFPLWYTLLGLLCAIIVHEGFHGIFSASYNIKIKSSGFAFLGPIPGAFVEPDEKALQKRPKRQQLAVFSAGPFANVILAIVMFLLALGVSAIGLSLVTQDGVHVTSIQVGSGAATAGMENNSVITAIDGQAIHNLVDLSASLAKHKIGDTISVVASGKQYSITLGISPDDKTKPYMGVLEVETQTTMKTAGTEWLYGLLVIVTTAIVWIYIISLGLGIANLLPIGPVDGGRMFMIALTAVYPEKRAKQIWIRWSFLLLGIVLILVFVPIIRAIL